MCVRSCRRLQPSDKLGINSLERNLGSSPLTVVTECLTLPLGISKKGVALWYPDYIFLHLTPFSPSRTMQVPKLLPVLSCILCAHGLCCRAAPGRAGIAIGVSLGEAFSAGYGTQPARGGAGTTTEHRAP